MGVDVLLAKRLQERSGECVDAVLHNAIDEGNPASQRDVLNRVYGRPLETQRVETKQLDPFADFDPQALLDAGIDVVPSGPFEGFDVDRLMQLTEDPETV
jgi:hypothetical protein